MQRMQNGESKSRFTWKWPLNDDELMMMMMMMMMLVVRVHPVHLRNVKRCQVAVDPETKPTDFSRESVCRLPESTPTITI